MRTNILFAEKFDSIICFGTSNIRRYKKELKINFPGCKYVLTYTLDELEDEIHQIQDEKNVFIHVLGNDCRNICKLKKSGPAKEIELKKMLKRFFAIVQKINQSHPDINIFISSCLPRYDGLDKLHSWITGPDFINAEIAQKFQNSVNITLISNDGMMKKYYCDDNFHVSSFGFSKIMFHWRTAIGKLIVFLDLALENS